MSKSKEGKSINRISCFENNSSSFLKNSSIDKIAPTKDGKAKRKLQLQNYETHASRKTKYSTSNGNFITNYYKTMEGEEYRDTKNFNDTKESINFIQKLENHLN